MKGALARLSCPYNTARTTPTSRQPCRTDTRKPNPESHNVFRAQFMSMKFPGFATLLMCAALVFAQQPAANTKTKLLDITQRLLDAIALGDKSVWAQYLAEDVVFTGD